MISSPPPRDDASAATYGLTRAWLDASGLGDDPLLARLGISSIGELGRVQWSGVDFAPMPASLAVGIRLFLQGAAVPDDELRRGMDAGVIQALQELGLLQEMAGGGSGWVSTVLLYRVFGFWVVSDRVLDAAGAPITMGADAVFPGLYPGTLRFLRLIPTEAGRVLDVCGGCGIGALVASRNAGLAVTSDLTERATRFARFNLRLNAVENVRCVEAPGYSGVDGETFDLITAHPPYVPSLGDGAIFRDGGSLGEDVLQPLVEQLPTHLRRGGRALILCFGRHTHEATLAQRVRGWLGDAGGEFDLLLGEFDRKGPREIAVDIVQKLGPGHEAMAPKLEEHFLRHGTREFCYGVLLFERHREVQTPVTEVLELSRDADAEDLLARLDWARWKARKGYPLNLAMEKPRLAPGLELHTRYEVSDGAFVPVECLLRHPGPYPATAKVEPGMIPLLACHDGSRTAGELFREAEAAGRLPPGVALESWLWILATMMDRGFLCRGARSREVREGISDLSGRKQSPVPSSTLTPSAAAK